MKFELGEEVATINSPTKTVATSKKPVRQHIKRKSSGRVHVAKIVPMTRTNSSNTNIDSEDDNEQTKPVIKRSQSNRSLHKLSFERKARISLTPQKKVIDKEKFIIPTTNNPASLTSSAVAEPIEQTFNTMANNLVVPKLTPPKVKKQLLYSQFLDEPVSKVNDRPVSSAHVSLSRTQQKLMLQKQQALTEDENSPYHPRNMCKLNKEFDMVGREYRNIRKYQDPMLSSLVRCMKQCDIQKLSTNPHVSRLQLGANQRSNSSFAVLNSKPLPHLEQRQIALRQHYQKTSNTNKSTNNNKKSSIFATFPWHATALLDRLLSSTKY